MAQFRQRRIRATHKLECVGIEPLITVGLSSLPLATRSGRTGAFPVLMMLPWVTVNGRPERNVTMPFVCQPEKIAPAIPDDNALERAGHTRSLLTTTCEASKPTRPFSEARSNFISYVFEFTPRLRCVRSPASGSSTTCRQT